jgi:hypothetical protein
MRYTQIPDSASFRVSEEHPSWVLAQGTPRFQFPSFRVSEPPLFVSCRQMDFLGFQIPCFRVSEDPSSECPYLGTYQGWERFQNTERSFYFRSCTVVLPALDAALGIGRSACASIDQNYRIRPQTVGLPRGRYADGRAPDPRTDGKRHCLYGVQPSCRHPAPQSRPAPHRTPGATEDWSPKGGLSLVQHPVAWRRSTLNDLNDAGAKAVETFR